MTNRDARNFQKGYQECLLDVYKAILNGGEEAALEWIRNNNAPTVDLFDKARDDFFHADGDADCCDGTGWTGDAKAPCATHYQPLDAIWTSR